MTNTETHTPPVCSYEGSDYQAAFWDAGLRRYEDAVEEIALKKLLTKGGKLMLELGAGAGRNTPRYADWQRVVLLDYSRTQLEQARQRLGDSPHYVFVAADIYKLPFVEGLFDGATMIRTLHHMADPFLALQNVWHVLNQNAVFILEFANKRNTKSVLRWLLRRQKWNPFDREQVEFVPLNYDFHPKTVRDILREIGYEIEQQLSVSHFRAGGFKRLIRHDTLVKLDAALQGTGSWCQYTPSVFTRARAVGKKSIVTGQSFFSCPVCEYALPEAKTTQTCPGCGHVWEYREGIYEFRISPES